MTCTCGAQGLPHTISCAIWRKEEAIPQQYRNYFAKLTLRLDAGAKEYGSKSFDKDSHLLIQDIQEEILDIAGWSYILWQRLENLKQQTKAL